MVRTNQFDKVNRLTNLVWKAGAATVASFAYQYNDANQKTRVTLADGSYWLYQYDDLGQVISGKKYWSDNTPVAGQQFEYAFDDIGNRRTNGFGGSELGLSLRESRYTVNNLNQYTSRTVPGFVNVLGDATNTASVSVNTNMAYRKDRYFRAEVGVNNSSSPVWLEITNVAVMPVGSGNYVVSNVTGHVFVSKTPETFGYDLDGNLTNDGRWTLTWDAENRLVNMTSLSSGPAGSKLKLDFSYDHQGRRIEKVVSTWNGSSYASPSTNQFVYDVWNLLAELDTSHSALRTYLWGLDLSGTMQGAGGVGGLLLVTSHVSPVTSHFVAYDGNGNVTALVKASDGTVSANYEYGPFGELLRATGLMAKANPFRFSTKYQDDESDLLYYGFRSYNPVLGRWLSRDPIEEQGFDWLQDGSYGGAAGPNLYNFVANNPLSGIDLFGLKLGDVPGEHTFPPYPPNPSMIGKKCYCMTNCPAHLTGTRTDTAPTSDSIFGIYTRWTLHLGVYINKDSDCYTDVRVDWTRCWGPGGAGYMGSGTSLDISVSTWLGIGTVYLTVARINYLTCENGLWVKKLSKAGTSYRWTGTVWEITNAGSAPTTAPPGS